MVTQVIAHRGHTEAGTENTLPALEAAAGWGAHAIEFDIRITKDERFVLMHDERVDRTTDGTGYVHELHSDRIRDFRTKSGDVIPYLTGALKTLEPTGRDIFVEIKTDPLNRWDEDRFKEVVGHINNLGVADRARLFTMYKPHVKTAVPVIGDIPMHYVETEPLEISEAVDLGLHAVSFKPEVCTVDRCQRYKDNGVRPWGRSSNEQSDWQKFHNAGADGFMTDDLRYALDYVRSVA